MSSKVHEIAVSGFGEGTNDLYDAARPSYPASALHIIARALAESQGHSSADLDPSRKLTILEPGAGTGIFSRLLVAPPSAEYPSFPLGTLVGVEPSSGMRGAWDRGLAKLGLDEAALRGKTVKVVDGSFEDFSKSGVEKGTVDLVVIAQAWHWCPDHEAAFREIASYLSPTGLLIFIWNLESNATPWHAAIRELYQPHDRGTPQYYKGWWREGFKAKAYDELFRDKQEKQVEWSLGMTEDQLVDRLLSKSYLTEAHLSGTERQDFIAKLRGVIRQDDKEWIDKEKGIFKYTYVTDVVIMHRK